jgi:hypothetical protein
MARSDQIRKWNQIDRPLAAAIGRAEYNRKQTAEKNLRRDSIAALVKKRGPALFLDRDWKRKLCQSFGVSDYTIHHDLRALYK